MIKRSFCRLMLSGVILAANAAVAVVSERFTALGSVQVSLSSATNQTFSFTEAPMLADLTVWAVTPDGSITNGGAINISVPEGWNCRFDSGSSISLSGNASGKIGTPAFVNGSRTLSLPVTADFADNDKVVVSGLKLKQLLRVTPDSAHLELDFDGDGVKDSDDLTSLTVNVLWPGGHFDGWDGLPSARYASLGGASVSLSSGANQTFDFSAMPLLSGMTLLADEPQGAITNGGTIRIMIPAGWRCRFDSGSAVTLASNAVTKVGTPYFADGNRALVLPVTADFDDGDALVISGLRLLGLRFVTPGTASLGLDFDGDGEINVPDAYSIMVRAVWPGGHYDGWDRNAAPLYKELLFNERTVLILR